VSSYRDGGRPFLRFVANDADCKLTKLPLVALTSGRVATNESRRVAAKVASARAMLFRGLTGAVPRPDLGFRNATSVGLLALFLAGGNGAAWSDTQGGADQVQRLPR
jgi:hypothetical protein